jgi:predicted regulator of Ras-like GTPase activity (Roadblock/LC7/MglB family)
MHARGLDVTGFTEALEALVDAIPEAESATFIDDEGEAVDLAARVDPFEARIAGAVLSLPLHLARVFARKTGLGEVLALGVVGHRRSVLTRHVGDGLDVVLVIEGTLPRARAGQRLAETAQTLRAAAGLGGNPADFEVEARAPTAGPLRPVAVIERGVRREVLEVLGVLHEEGVTHFLVRTDGLREMLLHFDHDSGRWRRV